MMDGTCGLTSLGMNGGPPDGEACTFEQKGLVRAICIHDEEAAVACKYDPRIRSPCGKSILVGIICQARVIGAACIDQMDLKLRTDAIFFWGPEVALGVECNLSAVW